MEKSFLFLALVYLGAAVLVVPVLKRLGLSAVLGYLLAGIMIGPFVLGLTGSEGAELMHVAEFGVVMMLFLIGLELNPEAFWKMRHQVLGFGTIQLLLTSGLLMLLFILIGFSWNVSLAIGLALTMSSTAIAMQNLKEKGLLSSAGGRASFSVLLFQDIAVIPILALLPLLLGGAQSESEHAGALEGLDIRIRAVVDLGAVLGIYLFGSYVAAPVLRFISKTGLREMFTASALLLVVSVGFLMEFVGLSPALGAFVAGVVLANSEFRHELESDIDPFKGLLLGLFFMSVGASINFALLLSSPGQIALIVLVVMLVKASVLFVAGVFFRISIRANYLFAFGLCQVGEFAFVLLALSYKTGQLSEEWLGKLNAVVAISMMLTPLLMFFYEKYLAPLPEAAKQETDYEVPETKGNVMIVGFGHFGSTVGRLLKTAGVSLTILDADSDQVQMVRKFGHKAFFGDATRGDLLHHAGIGEVSTFIAATGSAETNSKLAGIARKLAPGATIFIRTENRLSAYELMDDGFNHIYRETFHTAIRMGTDALTSIGFDPGAARYLGERFEEYDQQGLTELAGLRHHENAYAGKIRSLNAIQEEMLSRDMRNWKSRRSDLSDEGQIPES